MLTVRMLTARISTAALLQPTGQTPEETLIEASTNLLRASSTGRIQRTAALDLPIVHRWAKAAAHSMDLVAAAPHEWIVPAGVPASVAADSVAEEEPAVEEDSVVAEAAVVDGVRAGIEWRMK